MRAQFVRGQGSKDSLNIGNKFLEKKIRLEYELTPGIADKQDLMETGENILDDLNKMDPNREFESNNLYEDDIEDDHYYGVIYTTIHTIFTLNEIKNILIENNPLGKILKITIFEQ